MIAIHGAAALGAEHPASQHFAPARRSARGDIRGIIQSSTNRRPFKRIDVECLKKRNNSRFFSCPRFPFARQARKGETDGRYARKAQARGGRFTSCTPEGP